MTLSERDLDVWDYIRGGWTKGWIPTLQEIVDDVGVPNRSSAKYHVDRLRDAGLLCPHSSRIALSKKGLAEAKEALR